MIILITSKYFESLVNISQTQRERERERGYKFINSHFIIYPSAIETHF